MNDLEARALLIGNWEYEDPEKTLTPLKGPKNDLEVLRRALTHPEYGIFKDEDITVAKNLRTPDISTELLEFVKNARRRENLLIYYSGHGERLTKGQLGLCGVEVRFSAREAQAFDTERLRQWIERYERSASTVIILDCCYAGQFKGVLTEDLLAESFGQGTVVLSSGGNEPSPDAMQDDEPSPFTAVLAELLIEPTLAPKGGYVSTEDVYEAILSHEPKLLPPPRRNLQAQGRIPLARRRVVEETAASTRGLRGYRPDQSFETIDLLFSDQVCIADGDAHTIALLDPNRQAAVRRLSSLADALMRTKEYASQRWWQRQVGKAWQTVGANLFEAAVPESVQRRILERTSDASGTVLKVRLRFEERAGRMLEPYPWEYLQVGLGPSTVPSEGEAPISDMPLPLAVRPGLLIERVPRVERPRGGRARPPSTKPTVGVVNALPEPLSQLARRTATELNALSSVDLLFQLDGVDATWVNVVEALAQLPRHLVLFVPVNRDGRPAEFGFARARDPQMRDADWRDASRLVAEFRDLGLNLESLIFMTFAASPGNDTVRAAFELAQQLVDLGVAPVVFGCHWPGFERSVGQFENVEPETFPGLLLHALSQGVPLDRSVYYARNQLMRRTMPEFEALFGVPGYYCTHPSAVESPTPAAATSPGAGVISARDVRA